MLEVDERRARVTSDAPPVTGVVHATTVTDVRDAVQDLGQLHRSVELAKVRHGARRGPFRRADIVAVTLTVSDLVVLLALLPLVGRTPWILPTVFVACFFLVRLGSGSARPRLHLSVVEDLRREAASTATALGIGVIVLMLQGSSDLVATLVWLGAVFLGVVVAVRAVVYAVLRRYRRRVAHRGRTLVVGAGPVGRHVAEGLLAAPEFGLEPIGFVDSAAGIDDGTLPLPVLGTRSADLGDLIVEHDVTTVVAAFVADDEDLVDVLLTSTRLDTRILVVPRLFELASDDDRTDWINGVPLVRHTSGVTHRASWRVKRVVDCVVAAVAIVLLSPVLLAAAIGVLVEGGRPILFRQRRIGVDGVPFELLKFRSMRPADESESQSRWNIAGDPRVGPVGAWLRRTSVDELPQLLNILRGEMSLVGPRPERPSFVAQFTAEHSRYWARHRLPVGLTGWAQVNGLRGDTSIAQRARFDNFYIANWSLWLDLRIVLLTVREVLKGSGR
ncbi:sugar transferase [Jatrophihabitans sp. YIM 134969]